MANPIAVPGSNVAIGSVIGPGGAQGVQGLQGPTVVSADAGNIAVIGSDNRILVPQSAITSVRLRSFSSIGNPSMEVAQRNIGNAIATPANGAFIEDRWTATNTNLACTAQRATTISGPFTIPGTNFGITNNYIRFTVNTAKASLAASDNVGVYQAVEGPLWRELSSDVHSVSLLVRSSVSPFKFGLILQSATGTIYSLCKLCTFNAGANNVQLITLPSLPVWTSSATWNSAPGTVAYYLGIILAAGSNAVPSANDSWIASSAAWGALGQDNFMATAGAIFDVCFVQHCPGSNTDLIDLPFSRNLDECQRYFQKTYSYGTKPGNATYAGALSTLTPANALSTLPGTIFSKRMAKAPTMVIWSESGASNNVRDTGANVDRAVTTAYADESSLMQIVLIASGVANNFIRYHYTADTGW